MSSARTWRRSRIGREGDPYLLQSLAEAAQGESALPLVIITMQHLAFEEHARGTSVAVRREWVKVQGRFQDIPYVEAPRDAWRLIAAAVETRLDRSLQPSAFGTRTARNSSPLLACAICGPARSAATRCTRWPWRCLPELCTRYGQNERTLFSFMAGTEPLAVPAFLTAANWDC